MNEVQRLEVRFKEALTSGDSAKLHEIYARAIALVERRERPPVIAANKKAYEQLIYSYVCHVASSDARLPYVLWWRAYYGERRMPKNLVLGREKPIPPSGNEEALQILLAMQ